MAICVFAVCEFTRWHACQICSLKNADTWFGSPVWCFLPRQLMDRNEFWYSKFVKQKKTILIGSLSEGGSGFVAFLDSQFAQNFRQIVSVRVKRLQQRSN